MFGAAAKDEGDCACIIDVFDEDALVATDVFLCDGASVPQVVLGEVAQIRHDTAVGRASQSSEIRRFGPADREDTLLGEVMLGHIVDSAVSEDDVGADIDQFVDQFAKLLFFLIDELLELVGVSDVHFCVDFGLGNLDPVVEQCDTGVFDRVRHVVVDTLFVDDNALDEFGVVNRAANNLLDGDVFSINVVSICDSDDRVDN